MTGACAGESIEEWRRPDFCKATSLSCAVVFRSDGLRKAMEFLLGVLQCLSPVVRINIGCSSMSGQPFYVPVCDTDPKGMLQTRVPGPSKPFSVVASDSLDRPVIINDLDNIKADVDISDKSIQKLPFYQHAALLRLPLFTRGNLIFWINFWSDIKECYTEDDIPRYAQLLEDMITELKKSMQDKALSPLPVATVSNSFQKLSLCKGLAHVIRQIKKSAPTPATILILGESGVGKELVADAIHELSARRSGPLVKVNCGAISPMLLESELFGAEKGAYTGSLMRRPGYFEYANGGTIFLDEIGELSLAQQTKLLRVLDNHVIQRIGSPQPIPVDVRVVAATNRNLREMIRKGQFRLDLFYRLSIYPIHIPPLRERREDILTLANLLLQIKSKAMGIDYSGGIDSHSSGLLLAHDWPGNIRELSNVIERGLIGLDQHAGRLELTFDIEDRGKDQEADWPTLNEIEKRHIRKTLKKTDGRLTGPAGAAELLGIHYTTLHAKLKKYNMGDSKREP